jgi:homoserine kinase type II
MAHYSILQMNDIQQIFNQYGLQAVDYHPIEAGSSNTSYVVSTVKTQYVLTIFEIDRSRVEKIDKVLRLLETSAFPATRLQRSPQGETITSFQDKPVLVKIYIEGQVTADLNASMLEQLGTAMAKLHSIHPPDFLADHFAYGLQSFPRVLGHGIDLPYENWITERLKFFNREIPQDLPRGFIHGDVFFDNVLFEGSTLKALIDFEEVCYYYKVFDLGMAVVGLCAQDSQISLPRARSLIHGYQMLTALTGPEKENLQLFAEYAAIATSTWRYWKYNIDTPITEKADKHHEMARIARQLSSIPEKVFIDTVFG